MANNQRCPPPCPPPQCCPPPRVCEQTKAFEPLADVLCGDRKISSVFGPHQIPYIKKTYKTKNKSPSVFLGCVGLLIAETPAQTEIVNTRVMMTRFAQTLKFFTKIYITDELEFNPKTMMTLLKEGETLFTDSLEDEDPAAYDGDNTNIESENKVKREFELDNHVFEVHVDQKFQGILHGNPVYYVPEGEEYTADFTAGSHPLSLFKSVMKDFFQKFLFALVHFSVTHLLVWKSHGVYFVLDLFGRDPNTMQSDPLNGFSAMICLKTLDSVAYLVRHLSALSDSEMFTVQEMRLVRVVLPDGRIMNRSFGKRTQDYLIVRNDYAILKSNLHVSLDRAKIFRNRFSLAVGIVAILVSKIDHPATWGTPDLDKIICYGANIFRDCIDGFMDGTQAINLSQFPNNLRLGQFWVLYKLRPSRIDGIWKCVPYQNQGGLYSALKRLFETGANYILVQISFQMYTIIRKGNFFYLLDPYLHKIRILETEVEGEGEGEGEGEVKQVPKSASLRMFCHFDTMMEEFHKILLQNTKSGKFYLHSVVIKKITNEETDPIEHWGENDDCLDDNKEEDDVVSLNEFICFDIDERKCLIEFGQESDFEEEEEEIPWSEYEEEEMPGEEEENLPEPTFPPIEGEFGGIERGGRGRRGYKKSLAKRRAKGEPSAITPQDDEDNDQGKKQKTGKEKGTKEGGKEGGKEEGKEASKGGKDDKGGKTGEKTPDKAGDKAGKTDDKTGSKPGGAKGDEKTTGKESEKAGDKKGDDKTAGKGPDKTTGKVDEKGAVGKGADKKDEIPGGKGADKKISGRAEDVNFDKGSEKGASKKKDKEGAGKGGKDKTGKAPPKSAAQKKADAAALKAELDAARSKPKPEKFSACFEDRLKERNEALATAVQKLQEKVGHVMKEEKPYPCYEASPHQLCVVGAESGTYEDIKCNLKAGLSRTDRVLLIVPWGSYVVFETIYDINKKLYYLFSGCTCDINRFRYIDLSCGTEGLLPFRCMHDLVSFVIDSCSIRQTIQQSRQGLVEDVCCEFP